MKDLVKNNDLFRNAFEFEAKKPLFASDYYFPDKGSESPLRD